MAEYLGERRPAGHPVLYRNRGDGTFADVTAAVGLARSMPTMGSNYGDLDNDGFLDIYLGTGSRTWRCSFRIGCSVTPAAHASRR